MNDEHPTQTRQRRPTIVDRLWLLFYLTRVDFRLSVLGVGWSRRRRINDELKANVLDAAGDHGSLGGAFDALGTPKDLARAYADADAHRGFLHHAAGIWAVASFAALQAVGIGINLGFSEGAAAAGADERVSYAFEFAEGFGPFSGSYAPDPTVAFISMITPAHVVIMLAAGLIGGRIWRVFRRG